MARQAAESKCGWPRSSPLLLSAAGGALRPHTNARVSVDAGVSSPAGSASLTGASAASFLLRSSTGVDGAVFGAEATPSTSAAHRRPGKQGHCAKGSIRRLRSCSWWAPAASSRLRLPARRRRCSAAAAAPGCPLAPDSSCECARVGASGRRSRDRRESESTSSPWPRRVTGRRPFREHPVAEH